MENVESAVRRPKISTFVIVAAAILIIAIAAGIYFLFVANVKKEPSRGTYILNYSESAAYVINVSVIPCSRVKYFDILDQANSGGDKA